MHVPRIDVRSLDETVEAVDLGQTPADIVVLSFSDSDLNALARAYAALEAPKPTLRLASLAALRHPYSIDLYCERVGSRGEADRRARARRRRLLALRRRRTGRAGASARDQARAASGRPPRRSAARGGLDARARGLEPHLALFRRGRPRQSRRLPRLSLGSARPGGRAAGPRAGRGVRAFRAGLPRRSARRAACAHRLLPLALSRRRLRADRGPRRGARGAGVRDDRRLCDEPQGRGGGRAAGQADRGRALRRRPQRDRLFRPARRRRGDCPRRRRRAGVAGRARRQRRGGVARQSARPRSGGPRHARRPAGDRRPHPDPRRVVQGGPSARRGDRVQRGRPPAAPRSRRLRRRACGALGGA